MRTLVCLLEEPSAKAMLENILPRILPDEIIVKYKVFEGKQDLEKHIENKLKFWLAPNSIFLVMRDQDSGNCKEIKENLIQKVKASGKHNRTIIRIACRELESFYLGDLKAVEKGLEIKNLGLKQVDSKYRTPDKHHNAFEILEALTHKKYQKISGSRAIGFHLNLGGLNKSVSFNVLIDGIKKLIKVN